MSERLPSGLLVGAMLRRVNDAGGIGTVLARGDAQAGAILVIALEKGVNSGAFERWNRAGWFGSARPRWSTSH